MKWSLSVLVGVLIGSVIVLVYALPSLLSGRLRYIEMFGWLPFAISVACWYVYFWAAKRYSASR